MCVSRMFRGNILEGGKRLWKGILEGGDFGGDFGKGGGGGGVDSGYFGRGERSFFLRRGGGGGEILERVFGRGLWKGDMIPYPPPPPPPLPAFYYS